MGTLYYDAQGGIVDPSSQEIIEGQPLNINGNFPTPLRTGFTFNGWYDGTNCSGAQYTGAELAGESDITLYACWTPKTPYTLTFDPQGGTVNPEFQDIYEGDRLDINGAFPTPLRTGFTFNGWFGLPECAGDQYTGEEIASTINITLYACWTLKTPYTLTFDPQGGTVNPEFQDIYEGDRLDINGAFPTPLRTGFTFNGWFTEINGGGEEYSGDEIATTDITLYAYWSVNLYTLTFDPQGGIVDTTTQTITAGQSLSASGEFPLPVKSGYTFTGWYTISGCGGILETGSSITSGDITLYACFPDWVSPGGRHWKNRGEQTRMWHLGYI
jgi:uncharacterized repeat protein (TIGR02543 family)